MKFWKASFDLWGHVSRLQCQFCYKCFWGQMLLRKKGAWWSRESCTQIQEAGSTSASSPINANNNHTYLSHLKKERERGKRRQRARKERYEKKQKGRKHVDRGQLQRVSGRGEKSWMYITSTQPCLHQLSDSSVPALKVSSLVLLNYCIVSDFRERSISWNTIFVLSYSWHFQKRITSHSCLNQSYWYFSVLPELPQHFDTYFH